MTDTIQRIEDMGIKVAESEGSVNLQSVNYNVRILPDNELEWNLVHDIEGIGNNEEWENLSTEIDNLNRAIFWIRTLK